MAKKIVWILIVVGVLAVAAYVKFGYAGSQFQLRNAFRFVEAFPIEHWQNATEKSCGIWYESGVGDKIAAGKKNEAVVNCFKNAFKECDTRNILLIKDQSENAAQTISYALIRILRKNDLNECIIQNYYEEANMVKENEMPLSYINTCTVLADNLMQSCEPLFIKEARQNNMKSVLSVE